MLLAQQLVTVAGKASSQAAIRFLGKDIKYGELRQRVMQLSYLYLKELGPDSRVAFYSSNCPAYLTTFLALTNIRAVTIPLDPSWTLDEIGAWLKRSEATHLAVSGDLLKQAREVVREVRSPIAIIEIEKKQGGEYDQSFSAPPDQQPTDKDLILLLPSGGTTGPRKLVAFDHTQLHHAAVSLRALYRTGGNDRVLTDLNFSHPFAFLHGMLFPVLTGSILTIDHGLENREFLEFLNDNKVNRLVTTPNRAERYLNLVQAENRKLPFLKAMVLGTASPMKELEDLSAACRVPLVRCYGQAENVWTIALDDFGELSGKGPVVSKGVTGLKYKVMDANGDEIETKGERVGMLAVSGPTVMLGYRDADKKVSETATKLAIRGTWLYTQDIAALSEESDGIRLRILGRKEELLEKDGRFISPAPVDAPLKKILGVQDGAAFVMKDQKGNPVLACAVIKEPTLPLKEVDVLKGLQQSGLEKDLMPGVVFFVEFIPRNKLGQVNRISLGKQFNGTAVYVAETPETDETPADQTQADQTPEKEASDAPSIPVDPAPEPETESTPAAAAPSVDLSVVLEAAAASTTGEVEGTFVTFDLAGIPLDVPLPVTVYSYLGFRFTPLRLKGAIFERALYDQMECKKIQHLFVLQSDQAIVRQWNQESQQSSVPTEDSPPSDLDRARSEVRTQVMELFQSKHPDQKVEEVLQSSRLLVNEMMKGAYTMKPMLFLQKKSKGTADHSVNVSILAVYLAMQMGYDHKLILEHVAAGALLHDLGRVRIVIDEKDTPEEIKKKMREHPKKGVEVLEAVGGVPKEVKMIVEQHHECHDGSGYPAGLKGAAIYDLAQIVSISNKFETLVRKGSGALQERQQNAIEQLSGNFNPEFDPQKLQKVLKILKLGI